MVSRTIVPAAFLLGALLAGCQTVREIPPPPVEQWTSMRVTATAYNSTAKQTDGRPNEAAWGARLHDGQRAIAVSADLVKAGLTVGTLVEIEGLSGTYEVLDRMPPGRHHAIDVFMGSDVAAAKRFGRRELTIRWRVKPPQR